MTIADGNLVIKGESESGTIALKKINKMYFSNTPTAITSTTAYERKKALHAYDLNGSNCFGNYIDTFRLFFALVKMVNLEHQVKWA